MRFSEVVLAVVCALICDCDSSKRFAACRSMMQCGVVVGSGSQTKSVGCCCEENTILEIGAIVF